MTAQELSKLANEKNYFGLIFETLYAFEDGNMYGIKEDADLIAEITGKKYHVIKKGEKEIKEEVQKSKKDK
jgi:hypothetical protein